MRTLLTILFVAAMIALHTGRAVAAMNTAQIVKDLGTGDDATIAQVVAQVRKTLDAGQVPNDLARRYLPAPMNMHRYQAAADLALAGALARPSADSFEMLMDVRVRALLGMGRAPEALSVARSCYNVSALKNTGGVIDLVCACLVACHPEDPGLAIRFRGEQAEASAVGAGQPPAGHPTGAGPDGQALLKSVTIDPTPFAAAIDHWSSRNSRAADRIAYADLLLAAGRAADAEQVFRGVFLSATTKAELTSAIDGIARSLRAQDGTVERADAWLNQISRSGAAAHP